MLIEFPFDAHRNFPYETVHPRNAIGRVSAVGCRRRFGKSGGKRKKSYMGEKEWREESSTALKEEGKETERRKKDVMQSGKPCRSPFVRSHASYWFFAYTSFSLLHGSVFDQSNGIFSTTRVLDGRDPGDIGHFLVAIRQWKPPTVKTTGKEKRERNTRGVKVVCLCLAAGLLSSVQYHRLYHRHRIRHNGL